MPIYSRLPASSQGKGKEVNTLEDLKIVMDGIQVDSMIPTDIRTKYFNLCTNQNAYLHKNFNMKGNEMLCVGTVLEIVRISDAVRAANMTTPLVDLEDWDDILKAFEGTGMTVGFIRERISNLIALHSNQAEMVAERVGLDEEENAHRTWF